MAKIENHLLELRKCCMTDLLHRECRGKNLNQRGDYPDPRLNDSCPGNVAAERRLRVGLCCGSEGVWCWWCLGAPPPPGPSQLPRLNQSSWWYGSCLRGGRGGGERAGLGAAMEKAERRGTYKKKRITKLMLQLIRISRSHLQCWTRLCAPR